MSVERYTAADIADFAAHRREEFVNAKDYDAAAARVEAAEQDAKNGWKAFADAVKVVDEQKALVFAAEARLSAAERERERCLWCRRATPCECCEAVAPGWGRCILAGGHASEHITDGAHPFASPEEEK